MNVHRRMNRTISAAGVLAAAVAATSVPAAASAPSVAAVPAPASVTQGTLSSVAGTSAGDVWAVGSGPSDTLVEHWNGVRWRVVPSPSPGTGASGESELYGVAAVSRTDAWAVGSYSSGPDTYDLTTFALIEHWNGRRWRQVPCPCSSSDNGVPALAGIAAVSPSDIWAVGAGVSSPLIVHWNGRKWAKASLPGNEEDQLTAVSATSARNAWAVGLDVASDAGLTAHWNGRKWNWVRSPEPGDFNELNAVAATSESRAWAVGEGAQSKVKILRWNGRRWSQVAGPRKTAAGSAFYGIGAARRGSLWAVGQRAVNDDVNENLAARWTGTRWVNVPTPNSECCDNMLSGVYVESARNVWAVGGNADLMSPVIEHWNGRRWRLVAS
jgi:hypothetical protein